MEKHSVLCRGSSARLPATLDTKEGGQLTEKSKTSPVIRWSCLTRLRKSASRCFSNVLLQILEDGRPHRRQGPHCGLPERRAGDGPVMSARPRSFELSNKDPERGEERSYGGGSALPSGLSSSTGSMKLSSSIPLGKQHLERIVGFAAEERGKSCSRNGKITLELTPAAARIVAPRRLRSRLMGARPLRRTIQRLIQDPLALEILQGAQCCLAIMSA